MDFWDHIYFSPYSLGRFPVLIFSSFGSLYLLLHPARSIQSTTAGLYFVFSFLFHLGFFLAYSLNHPTGAYGYYLTALSPLGVSILIQFAYLFPRDTLPIERKIIFYISGMLSLVSFADYFYFAYTSGVGAFTAGYGSFYISRSVPVLVLTFYSWSFIVFLRKTIFHSRTFHADNRSSLYCLIYPGGKEGLACRNFALLNVLEILNTSILTSGLLFRAFPYIQFLTFMNLIFFLITSLYVILFLRYLVGSTPITFKVVHFSLLSTLFLCIIAGNILTISLDQSFRAFRMEQIHRTISLFPFRSWSEADNNFNLPIGLDALELILLFQNDGSHKTIYQSSSLSIPNTLNLWREYPGLMEYKEKTMYESLESLKKLEKTEFYLRISNTNLQFYPVVHNNNLYGLGFNYIGYRKFIHPSIKNLFLLFLSILLINFLFLPLYLSKNFSEPFQEILSGLYQNKDVLLLPSNKNNPRDELDVLRETLFQLRDEIEINEIHRKENIEKEETTGEEEDSISQEFILKESTIQKIKKVETYLKENFTYELSREGLAAMVNLSPGRLGKYFKMTTGKKISDYINELRIEKARTLLTDTGKTVIEIAFEVGFESLRTFNRVFFSEVGMNPGQYRQKNRTI